MKGKLKVLFFISSLEGGGAERVMVDLLRYINRKRIAPTLVLLDSYEGSPYKKSLPQDFKTVVLSRKTDRIDEKIKQFAKFLITIREQNPDIIISFLTHTNILAICASIIFRIKVIACQHIHLSESIKVEKRKEKLIGIPIKPLVKIFFRFADKIITVSEEMKIDLIREFSIPANKVRVIYNPIDMSEITNLSHIHPEHPFFNEGTPILLSISRFTKQKGLDTLIKAFNILVMKMDLRLIILGKGPQKEFLKKMLKDFSLTDKVSLEGFHNNPYGFLSKATIFILSSRYEGFPVVMLEALACRTPIISTDCKSGPREILKGGKYGLLVPVEDENALSDGIIRLLKDENLRKKLSKLGQERASDFSIEHIVEQYENILYEVILSKKDLNP